MQLFIHRENQQFGPYTEAEIYQRLGDGTLLPDDLAWRDGLAEWVPLSQLVVSVPPRSFATPPVTAGNRIDHAKVLPLTGATLLFLGAFTPVLSVPIVGGLTFLRMGWPCYVVLACAAASIGLVLASVPGWLWLTSAAVWAILLGCLAKFLYDMHQANAEAAARAAHEHGFGSLVATMGSAILEAVQLQWGCFILGFGAALIAAGAYYATRTSARSQ